MPRDIDKVVPEWEGDDADRAPRPAGLAPGKRTLTSRMPAAIADEGVASASVPLPHGDAIQASFGRHDVSGVRAQVGGVGAAAAAALGADAFATGDRVAFAGEPDLRVAAHEAAHVIQQRRGVSLLGGAGSAGDAYEGHADAVADAVVRGASAEALLDAAPTGGAAGPAVQRWSWGQGRRAAHAAERRQVWDDGAAQRPLATDDNTGAAVRANAALGFTPDKVLILRRCLEINTRRGPIIDREFATAVAERQPGEGTDGDPDQPESRVVRPGSGVLDEDTVIGLEPGRYAGGLAAARGHYRNQPPWAGISDVDLDAIVAALHARLGITSGDLHLDRRGRVAVSQRFVRRVVAWQMWHHRARSDVQWGRLSADDLDDLGAPVPAADAAPAAEGEARAADGEAPATAGGDSAAGADGAASEGADAGEAGEAEATVPEARDAQGLTATERGRLDDLGRRITRQLGRYPRTRRLTGDAQREARAAIDRDLQPILDEAQEALTDMSRPNLDFAPYEARQTVANRARWMRDELRSQLGARIAGHGDVAEARRGPAAAAGAATGPERRSAAESQTALQEGGFVVGEHALDYEGWDGRVMHRRTAETATQEEVGPAAERVGGDFQRVIDSLGQHRSSLDSVSDRERLALMTRLCGVSYQPIARLRRDPFPVRVPWRPGDPERLRGMDAATLRARARRWSRALRGEIQRLRREQTNQTRYRSGGPAGNPAALEVDLNRSGVTVLNNRGGSLSTSQMRLDPQFADAMVRFLSMLSGLGCSALWTAGFLRQPISPMDTHPQGKACDITGFQFGDTLLHLRSGRPVDPPAAGDTAAETAYDAVRGGHSDWFDHHGRFPDGRTHEEVMHAITARMRSYFSRIIGPGANARHMNHWHVELTGRAGSGPQVQAIARDTDMPDEVRNPADRRAPEWMTPSERASFPDGSE